MGMACSVAHNHLNKLSIPFRQNAPVKCGENCSSGSRKDGIKQLYNFIHVNSPGTRSDNLRGQNVDCY